MANPWVDKSEGNKGMWVLIWEDPIKICYPAAKIFDTKNKAIMAAIKGINNQDMVPFKVKGVYRLVLEE